MARGKITLDAEQLCALLQMPNGWQIQAIYASPEDGRIALIVTGDFDVYPGRGVPDYHSANHIEVRCSRTRADEDSPWVHHVELKPETYRKEQAEK